MNERCPEADLHIEAGKPLEAAERKRWQKHLAGCSSCQGQMAADQALRRTFTAPPVINDEALALALQRELARREFRAHRASKAGSRPSVRWVLGIYATVAAGASLWLILSLPWPVIPAMVPLVACGMVSLLVPALLFDRTGFLRPPN